MRASRVALAACLVMASGAVGSTARAAECDAFEVYTPEHGSKSTLVRLELPSGTGTELRSFSSELNAIGYSSRQNLLYGVSSRSHVVTLDRGGEAVDRGKVHGIGDATAGAISGSVLYLRDGMKLASLDIDPGSPTYLKVVRWKWLSWPADVDDFDFGPDALLYGVTGAGVVVSIDPVRGKVRVVGKPKALPHGTYGAVLMGPGRVLYAIDNRSHGKSRLYRIPLGALGSTAEVAAYAPADTTDAAGCLTPPPVVEPPAPPPPPVVPPPTSVRPVPPRVTSTSSRPTPPAPATTTTSPSRQPVQQVVQPPVVPPPVVTSKTRRSAPVSARPVAAAPARPDTEKKRRWALTTLVLVLGAGAAVAAAARRRP